MKWINTTDLKGWADRRDCQETLPLLVRRLIRATSSSIKNMKFPAGDSILTGGWDGILEIKEETDYLPLGTSLWEFGAGSNPKGKADEDYKKRSKNPLGYDPATSTFIFVTPRLWTQGDKWIKEKKKDGIWKDVRVLNAEKLEEWLELAPAVSEWLAKAHLNYPSEGIMSSQTFWDEWSVGPDLTLNSKVLLGGRDEQVDKLFEVAVTPNIVAIQAASRGEALAFIIASFKNDPDREEDFFARSIIVDNVESFRQLLTLKTGHILIPRFEDTGIMNKAVADGHTVLTPLGGDLAEGWSNKIELGTVDREAYIVALTESGLTKELAEKYSKESARNITILRRQLEFARGLPPWAAPESIRDIIPALIVGRWDEKYDSDKAIVADLAGESYDEYSKKLNRWLLESDSPLVKIGTSWRLASPLDTWTNASKHLTKSDLELLQTSFHKILTEIDPAFELEPERRVMAAFYGKNSQFSTWIREGIIQSLILVSVFGDQLRVSLPMSAETWVDGIVSDLLVTDDPLFWKSIHGKLPLIAEASPSAFLSAIESQLEVDNSPMSAVFEEDPGLITPTSYHTGLLWALEGVSWLPDHLSRSALVLAKLAAIDPGGSLSNRPKNSLAEIFKSWHYQTLSSFEERIAVLKLIASKEIEVAWNLLLTMLPSSNGVSFPTRKFRWRMFGQSFSKSYKYQEIWDTHTAVVDLLLSLFDFTGEKRTALLEVSICLGVNGRDKVLSFIESNLDKVEDDEFTSWNQVRSMLSHHRSFPDAEWSEQETVLERYQTLYESMEPSNEIQKSIWMFNDHWPSFPDGRERKKVSHEEQDALIRERRIESLKGIYNQYGLNKIKELSKDVEQAWAMGSTLAYIIEDEAEILSVCKLLGDEKSYQFVNGFMVRKFILNGYDWTIELFGKLRKSKLKIKAQAQYLISINPSRKLWDFVDSLSAKLQKTYWSTVDSRFFSLSPDETVYGIKKLLQHKRYLTALDVCHYNDKDIPSSVIVEVLDKASSEKTDETVRLSHYHVEKLFKTLDERDDVDLAILIQIEWAFLPFLTTYGSTRNPKLLHKELSTRPEFFIDALKLIYRPKNKELLSKEMEGVSEDQIQNRAKHGYKLMDTWKNIPGVDADGKIDEEFLWSWINKVRELAKAESRVGPADMHIGKVIAHYPEGAESWPPDELCNVIETINTDSIKENFSAEVSNKRSSSTRSAFAGGEIEMGHASYFEKLAANHKNRYPVVAALFNRLVRGYKSDSKRMDERAERDALEY